VGYNAENMKKFIENGVDKPADLKKAIVPHDENVDTAIAALNKKAAVVRESDGWTDNQLENEWEEGCQILYDVSHGGYDHFFPLDTQPGGRVMANEISNINSAGRITENRTHCVVDACRVGVVTDDDGSTWSPEWDDCILYALVNQDCSGVIAAGGKAIFNKGIKLTNDYFSRLLKAGSESLQFGTALRDAKVHYDKGWFWDGGEKKTVTEFIYYGLPWGIIDPEDKAQKDFNEGPSVSINISNPFYISPGKYGRTITINVTNYNVSKVDGYDLIEINGAELTLDEHMPIIPIIKIVLPLPLESTVTDVSIVNNISEMIGYYNIPSYVSAEKPGKSGYKHSTVVGFYPLPSYQHETLGLENQIMGIVRIAPIQYNPQTNETILYNYTKLELTYQTPITAAITDFSPTKTEYTSGEPISTSVTIENVGSDALTGLQADLSLIDLYGGVRASSLSAPFDVASGESKTVYATVSQNLPHGSYLAEIQVINSTGCILGSSSEYIFITSGSIVDFFLPREVVAGEDITFTIRFKNARTSGVEGTGVVNIYDPSDMKIAEVYSDPTSIAADSTGALSITWNTGGKDIGLYTASAVVHVGEETFGPVSDTFTIILRDTTLPRITEVRPGNITSKSGDTINFNCLVTDNVAVDSIRLSYTTNNWTTYNVTAMDNPHDDFYTTTLTLPLEAGALNYKIEATDTAGNIAYSSIYTITALKGIVLFDESHAEIFSIAPNAKYSYSKLASLLEPKGYEAKTLDSTPITVSNNGSLLLINEWGGDFRQGSNLNDIAENFGIVFNNDLVNDPTNNFHNTPTYAIIHEFSRHSITKGINEFLYPAGCSLIANSSIARADDDSYTTLPKIPIQALAEEERGSITVLAATNFEGGRVVCIGDGDFCSDLDIDGDGRANIDEYDNKKLALNIVEWLSRGAIMEPPVASFTYTPPKLFTNQAITFNASSSYDPDGSIENYSWEFGDGANGTGEIVTYSYSAAGTYNVTLTVTDDDGATNKKTEKIELLIKGTYVPDAYPTIQAAVDAAAVGDTIVVRDGIYTENIVVNMRLTIKSEKGADRTIVQAGNLNDPVFEVTADYVNLSGFTVEGAAGEYPQYAGIYLEADYCNIANNIILNNYDGLCLRYSLNNRITSNNISDNTRYGIELGGDCKYNTIYGNSISLNEGGLSLDSSSNNEIYNNTINSNRGYGGISTYSTSRNNRIYLNNFVNNSKNAISHSSANAWNSPGKISYTYNNNRYRNYLGNYWSDYTGYDLNHDGIGDVVHNIYPIRDNYPLMKQWEKYF
jgi:parallel beta-helix repeat protein